MKSVEATGKTVDDAIIHGLSDLNVSIDEVDVEVLQGGSKGLFGLGGKESRVRLTIKDDPALSAEKFLSGLFEKIGIDVLINTLDNGEDLEITLNGPSMGMLIGHRGETLDALQFITSLVVNKSDRVRRIRLDAENYRKKREAALVSLARKIASRVHSTGLPVSLEPMTPNERRLLHSALQNSPYVMTHSEGEEPNRYVVVEPK